MSGSASGSPPPVARGPGEDEEGSRIAREVAGRAIRRLGIFEGVILVAAVGVALLAGAVVAFLVSPAGLPFRPTWTVASLVFLIVPAVLVWFRDRREE